jgi:hypothetical protein
MTRGPVFSQLPLFTVQITDDMVERFVEAASDWRGELLTSREALGELLAHVLSDAGLCPAHEPIASEPQKLAS